MTDSASIQNLFKAGLTREQFLDKYTELKANADPENSSSVFNKNMSSQTVSAMFDVLDKNHDNSLDEGELRELSNYTTNDGQDTFTDDDINALYEKTIQYISEKYGTDNPEEMYNKAVNSGELSQFDYTQMISSQIGILNELIEARNLESNNKISRYQAQIDDLIMRSTQVSTDTKAKYNEITTKIKKTERLAERAQREAEDLHDRMLDTEANIEYLKRRDIDEDAMSQLESHESDYHTMSGQYASLTSDLAQYSDELSRLKNDLSTLQKKAMEEDSELKERVDALNNDIETERTQAASDINGYNMHLQHLSSAQQHAMSQPAQGASGDYSDEDTSNFSYDAAALKEKWAVKGEPQFSDGFYNKVVEISKRVGCDPNALMAVMKSESGLKTTARNPHGGATGLIQFMPSTAKALGTSTEALSRMSPEEQLVYVEKFLVQNKKMAGFSEGDKLDSGTLYTLVFLPAYAKRDVLCTQGTKYYKYNAGLDLNHDGQITKQDMSRRVHQFMK